jgi:hypothetical protein
VFIGHTDAITTICVARNGKLVYTAAKDRTIRQWNTATSEVRAPSEKRGVARARFIDESPPARPQLLQTLPMRGDAPAMSIDSDRLDRYLVAASATTLVLFRYDTAEVGCPCLSRDVHLTERVAAPLTGGERVVHRPHCAGRRDDALQR